MMWAKLDFFHGNIYNTVFLDKKNHILKILSTWVFVAPKCQKSFNTLQLVWTLIPNKFCTKYFRCLISGC